MRGRHRGGRTRLHGGDVVKQNPAVAWLERDYDKPYAFRPRMNESHPGLYVLKPDHLCVVDCLWWDGRTDAWRWTP